MMTKMTIRMTRTACLTAAMAALPAAAAVWTGGASGTLNDPANWDGDITATTMVFTNDCTVSLSGDITVKHPLTYGPSADVPNGPVKQNAYDHSVIFDLDGKTLTANYNGTQYWRSLGMSATFMGGGTFSVTAGSTTNEIVADNGNHYDMTFTVTGAGTRFIGSWVNRIPTTDKPGARFRLLDGAEAEGRRFFFGGFNTTNEVSGGSRLRYHAPDWSTANGVCVGGQLGNPANGGSRDVLVISGAGTVMEPIPGITAGGYFKIGNGGNGGNSVIVRDGASLTLPCEAAIGHGAVNNGVEYHSNSNELVVTGHGTTLFNRDSNVDKPTAVGRRGSFNRLLVDDGALARLNCLSCGGEIKGQLNGNPANSNQELAISSFLSAYNTVTVDNGATLDANCVMVGWQHTDSKQSVARLHGQCYSNRVEILGGASLFATNGQTVVGTIAPYFGNVLSVSGAGTTAKFTGVPDGNGRPSYAVTIGQGGSCSNRFEVLDGAHVELDGALFIAEGVGSSQWGYAPDGTTIVRGIGNEVRVEGAGSTLVGVSQYRTINLGSQTNGNSNVLWVGDGATMVWSNNMAVAGFDNAVVVSNGTFTLTGNILSAGNNPQPEVAGRTRFVFAGAAPKFVIASANQSRFTNGTVFRFEVPPEGWTEAPLQLTGQSNAVRIDDDSRLEVEAESYAKRGGGEVELATSGKKLGVSVALLAAWNGGLRAQDATVRLSDDEKKLILKVRGKLATMLIIR